MVAVFIALLYYPLHYPYVRVITLSSATEQPASSFCDMPQVFPQHLDGVAVTDSSEGDAV